MPLRGVSLSVKISSILLGFFLVALLAVGLTLFISWQLEGAAAAINDAGSLRMRVYRIAHHLVRADDPAAPRAAFAADLQRQIDEFDTVLVNLRAGDPLRPLFVPKDEGIPADIARLQQDWATQVRPLIADLVATPTLENLRLRGPEFDRAADAHVHAINDIVLKMEHSYAYSTNVLRASQVLLIALAIVGTILLLRFFFLTVIRPVYELQDGVKRMEREDFAVRVPILAGDEFGDLSSGFNQMASHLQSLYDTLEERVAAKTRSLEQKNRELKILYDIGAFLREPKPNDVDSLCKGFLERVQKTMGATASSARLLDVESRNLCMIVHDGLGEDFVDREEVLACGECVFGEVAKDGRSLTLDVRVADLGLARDSCARAGFETVSAISISANKRTLGVFNLYFAAAHPLDDADRQLLEILGQQLGIAIENQRLHARDREMAVSEERNLLARELHDSIAQGLAFLNLQVQMLERALADGKQVEAHDIVGMLRRGVEESYEDVRELLVHFRTRVERQDLDAAITAALRRLAEQTGVATDLDVQGDGAPLDPEAETQVLYIVQEALSNVRKHAGAQSVMVSVRRGREGLSVSVRDDGIGFGEGREEAAGEAHIGLQIMRERAMRIGGHFAVRSSPGRGTEIRLDLPRQAKVDI
jgi:two-component system nitrate/nitrite sensor histidine kinase NarX